MQLKPVGLVLLAFLFLLAITGASYTGYRLAKSDAQRVQDQIAQITVIPVPTFIPSSTSPLLRDLYGTPTPLTPTPILPFTKTQPIDAKTVQNDAYTWLAKPKLETNDLALKGLLQYTKTSSEYYFEPNLNTLQFFELGSGQKIGKVYLVFIDPEGPNFFKPHFVFIPKYNTIMGDYGGLFQWYFKNLKFTETRIKNEYIPDLFFPTTLISKGVVFTRPNADFSTTYSYPDTTETSVPPKVTEKILDNQNGYKLLAVYSGYKDGYTEDDTFIRTNFVINKAGFKSNPYKSSVAFISDDGYPRYIPTFGHELPNRLAKISNGCGIDDEDNIYPFKDFSSLTQIGIWKDQKIYALSDTQNSLFKTTYQRYLSSTQYNQTTPKPTLSELEFLQKPTHVIWQDNFGDWQYLVSDDYQVQAECGKPVIYLYPDKPTEITVQVGADVTVSEPTYSSGWKNVVAQPSGQLSYQGQTYSNLFWEGTGHGPYPQDSRSRGVIVPSSQSVATITSQLQAQGLNQQEIADFLAFWQPKLPTKNYVRLTWLTKLELDNLAPLYVNPVPKNSIRVFLEFEELSAPYALSSQSFTKPTRSGYTLVEWGGLLIKSN